MRYPKLFKRLIFLGMVAPTLLNTTAVFGGNFGVSPLSVNFNAGQKSAVLTISNEDARPVSLRLRAMRWTQDASGKDQYVESKELIFFPKRIDANAGESKIVRVGITNADMTAETAYRLYIEELPPARPADNSRSLLSVLITIGIPVFVGNDASQSQLAVTQLQTSEGRLNFSVENTGRAHARISRLVTDTGFVVSEGVDSRYVFPGIAKNYSVEMPRGLCTSGAKKLRIETETGVTEADLTELSGCTL